MVRPHPMPPLVLPIPGDGHPESPVQWTLSLGNVNLL